MHIGAPVVKPLKMPDRISTLSSSLRCVVIIDWPGFLRSRRGCISASSRGRPAGHPSLLEALEAVLYIGFLLFSIGSWGDSCSNVFHVRNKIGVGDIYGLGSSHYRFFSHHRRDCECHEKSVVVVCFKRCVFYYQRSSYL